MRKTLLMPAVLMLLLASCTKKDSTTNNYTTVSGQTPSFLVEGLNNVTIINGEGSTSFTSLNLTVQYGDSTQEMVTLSLSGLPAGVNMDTTWVSSGYPTFYSTLNLYDSTTAGATPGVYTATLTATGTTTGAKAFPFKITIKNPPPCSSSVAGKYTDCESCTSSFNFADSVYADATVANKIWFTNFYNSGNQVYGILDCATDQITIPSQTVGGVTYSGTGEFGSHFIEIEPLMVNSTNCFLEYE